MHTKYSGFTSLAAYDCWLARSFDWYDINHARVSLKRRKKRNEINLRRPWARQEKEAGKGADRERCSGKQVQTYAQGSARLRSLAVWLERRRRSRPRKGQRSKGVRHCKRISTMRIGLVYFGRWLRYFWIGLAFFVCNNRNPHSMAIPNNTLIYLSSVVKTNLVTRTFILTGSQLKRALYQTWAKL